MPVRVAPRSLLDKRMMRFACSVRPWDAMECCDAKVRRRARLVQLAIVVAIAAAAILASARCQSRLTELDAPLANGCDAGDIRGEATRNAAAMVSETLAHRIDRRSRGVAQDEARRERFR